MKSVAPLTPAARVAKFLQVIHINRLACNLPILIPPSVTTFCAGIQRTIRGVRRRIRTIVSLLPVAPCANGPGAVEVRQRPLLERLCGVFFA